MNRLTDHPKRYALANELHARPFPLLDAPGHAVFLAIKQAEDAAARTPEADTAHLIALLDRFGAQHPQPGATHYMGELGRVRLKWERHTEFVTYTVFAPGHFDRPFDTEAFAIFPSDWLADAPGLRITSALIRVERDPGPDKVAAKLAAWFVPESLASSAVLDDSAIIAGDFRIDSAGHQRFAIFARDGVGSQRIGRIVQRLCEIETYKSMSMLGFCRARALSDRLGPIDGRLTRLMDAMTEGGAEPDDMLGALLEISAELETMAARSSFRFGATGAYAAIVEQRIEVLREAHYGGRQTFGEFMLRRFDPAMRTVKATQRRLQAMSDRAMRAGELLRTRVDVERSAQNQALLESMDRRADLQLRLQKTVEGLSVVAISYYALNLVTYLGAPFAKGLGLDKSWMTAAAVPLVVIAVWMLVHRIRKKVDGA